MAEKEYIERGAVISCILEVNHNLAGVIQHINEHVPAADVVEVRHGKWKAYPDGYNICATEFECSCCGVTLTSSELTDEEFLQMMKFCPNCGAKMDGERKADNE